MTEEEWLTSRDPQPMLRWLSEKASDRKRRLYACACCRRWSSLLSRDLDREALATVERFADGLATRVELWAAYQAATAPAIYRAADRQSVYASEAVGPACAAVAGNTHGDPTHPKGQSDFDAAGEGECVVQAVLVRDLFGNPFRPVAFSPEWHTDTATALARQMYESRDFTVTPILADALQGAGCDNTDVLEHCRGAGLHARGCWVVDLVLGKE